MSTIEVATKPRIWGEWQPCFYGSGTTNVQLCTVPRKPWLYVFADYAVDHDRYMRDRYAMCQQLADWMNGTGPKPVWLDDFIRVGEGRLESLSGGSIHACGPMIDQNPPGCNWVTDDSDDAVNDRARLIDALTGVNPR